MADRIQKMSNFNVLARRFAARLLRRGAPTRRASAIFCARDFAIAFAIAFRVGKMNHQISKTYRYTHPSSFLIYPLSFLLVLLDHARQSDSYLF